MRKAAGLLCALSLFVPVGMVAATSAGAAATALPTCTKLTGTVKYSPGLPAVTSTTKVNSTETTSLKISSCKGGGITSGTISGSVKYVGNCTTLVISPPKNPAPLKSTVKWSNGQTSTLSTMEKVTSKPLTTPVLATLTSKITAGLGIGHTATVKVKITAAAAACKTAALTGFTLVNIGAFTTK